MPDQNVQAAEVTEEAVLDHLRKIAREEFELPAEKVAQIQLTTPLIGGLQLDSLAQVVLISDIEERYGFYFDLEDREQLQTAKTIQDFIGIVLNRAAAEAGERDE
ncbi:MAG: acyl carrier protein [Acidobacteriota bacterium]